MDSGCNSTISTRSAASSTTSVSSRRSRAVAAIKRSPSLLSFSSSRSRKYSSLAQSHATKDPKWVEAEHGLEYLHHGDSDMIRIALNVANANYPGGDLFFRKIHTGSSGEIINWQLKFEHPSHAYEAQAIHLKDAARQVKSFLEYKEADERDQRFKALYDYARSEQRYSGGRFFFKEGKVQKWYPWKVKFDHPFFGFEKVEYTLSAAVDAMSEHLTYKVATPDSEDHDGTIWDRVFTTLENYPKCKVFFKDIIEDGPDDEPERTWRMKVDHPTRGIQFKASSRIFEEAAGQVCDYLEQKLSPPSGSKS